MIEVELIPVLKDNYAYLLRAADGSVGVVDPGDAAPVIAALDKRGLGLDLILNTHHHGDHIAGNAGLQRKYGAALAGPAAETARIPGMDVLLDEGSDFSFGGETVTILETPGHTRGHICLYFADSGLLFSGDTLFLSGCGRLFEGTAAQMWSSLQKLAALPDTTKIYCGHEYTLSNARFCLDLEPGNPGLRKRAEDVAALRAQNRPTLPGTIGMEKKVNAFLRAGTAEQFAEIRKRKDES